MFCFLSNWCPLGVGALCKLRTVRIGSIGTQNKEYSLKGFYHFPMRRGLPFQFCDRLLALEGADTVWPTLLSPFDALLLHPKGPKEFLWHSQHRFSSEMNGCPLIDNSYFFSR